MDLIKDENSDVKLNVFQGMIKVSAVIFSFNWPWDIESTVHNNINQYDKGSLMESKNGCVWVGWRFKQVVRQRSICKASGKYLPLILLKQCGKVEI